MRKRVRFERFNQSFNSYKSSVSFWSIRSICSTSTFTWVCTLTVCLTAVVLITSLGSWNIWRCFDTSHQNSQKLLFCFSAAQLQAVHPCYLFTQEYLYFSYPLEFNEFIYLLLDVKLCYDANKQHVLNIYCFTSTAT